MRNNGYNKETVYNGAVSKYNGTAGLLNPLLRLPDIAAFYDFTNLPLGATALVNEPIKGLNLAQTTGSRQPIAVDYLGRRCLYFDGSDDYMDAISTTGLFSGFNSGTIITVNAREDTSATMNVCLYSKASNTVMFQTRYASTASNRLRSSARMNAETALNAEMATLDAYANGVFMYGIQTATRNGAVTLKTRNVAKVSTSTLFDSAFTPVTPFFTVGANYNSTESSRTDYLKGYIQAVYCFNRALTDDEVTNIVEPYLLKRYGV